MTKWFIAFVVLIVIGAALWILNYGAILVAFLFGLVTGYILKTVRERSKA